LLKFEKVTTEVIEAGKSKIVDRVDMVALLKAGPEERVKRLTKRKASNIAMTCAMPRNLEVLLYAGKVLSRVFCKGVSESLRSEPGLKLTANYPHSRTFYWYIWHSRVSFGNYWRSRALLCR
jgi:hypothetical protein